MTQQSRVLFEGYGYTAAIAGFKAVNGPILSVTRGDKGGKYMTGQDALSWAGHIETAMDAREAAALCKAAYHG